MRQQRERDDLEKAFSFLIRVGLPGGICTPEQYLVMDDLADSPYANACLKLTTRQAFQLHGVLKKVLKTTVQKFNRACLNSLGACGDINRNVLCSPTPRNASAAVHAEVDAIAKDLNTHLLPKTSAYHEIWLDKKPAVDYKDFEPIYGRPGEAPGTCAYLPRKFKIAIAIPPNNDVDVFAHDFGLIAIVDGKPNARQKLLGFNVTVGGGMGMSHNNKETYPRLADVIGFVTPDQVRFMLDMLCQDNWPSCSHLFHVLCVRFRSWRSLKMSLQCNATSVIAKTASTRALNTPSKTVVLAGLWMSCRAG